MHFVLNRADCSYDAVSVQTGRRYVVEMHENGYFQTGSNLSRTLFDAIRHCEMIDAEQAEAAAKQLAAY